MEAREGTEGDEGEAVTAWMGNPTAPGDEFEAITVDVALATPSRGIYVGVAGNVQAFCALRNVNVTFVGAQAGSILPIRTTLIVSGGTTATSLVAIR